MHYVIKKLQHASKASSHLLEHFDYQRTYTLTSHILMFLFFSFVGWVWEIIFYTITEGNSFNRGVLHGPWLPVYGVGATLSILIYHVFKKSPLTTLLAIMAMATIVEYATAIYLENHYGMRWWDYSHLTFQLQGRICLRGIFFFGVMGSACIYIFGPFLDNRINQLSRNSQKLIVATLVGIFLADVIYSLQYPNAGGGITYHVHSMIENIIHI